MRKFLTLLTPGILVMLLAACENLAPLSPATEGAPDALPPVVELDEVNYWLQTAGNYMEFSPEVALQRLQALKPRRNTPYDQFRYALLNQQLRDRVGWIRARDTLRSLNTSPSLQPELKWLTGILLDHNQAMINAEQRRHQMAQELDASLTAQTELTKKITALTHLEQRISDRKEQVSESKPSEVLAPDSVQAPVENIDGTDG